MSRTDVERLHPNAPPDFTPTHLVTLLDTQTKEVLWEDAVCLVEDPQKNLQFGYVPGQEGPRYAVISSGLWQCLERHGVVRSQPVRYEPSYTPLHLREGYVYFIQRGLDGPVKIGWSQDVDRRLAELQTANAEPLSVIGMTPGRMCDEGALHKKFAHLRMEAEWFRDAPELREYLKSVGFPMDNPD